MPIAPLLRWPATSGNPWSRLRSDRLLDAAPVRCGAVSEPASDGARVTIRAAALSDAEQIAEIYNREVAETTSTFDLVPRSLADQRRWLAERSGAFAAIVAVDATSGRVVGFAALSPYKERAAYRTTVENSVYVHRDHGGRGVGKLLMGHLIDVARASGFHAIIARIEAGGQASRGLHEACGFELVGVEREVGRKFRRWLDVAIYQRML